MKRLTSADYAPFRSTISSSLRNLASWSSTACLSCLMPFTSPVISSILPRMASANRLKAPIISFGLVFQLFQTGVDLMHLLIDLVHPDENFTHHFF